MKLIGKKRRSRGVTLIEVLVTVIVLAFGLLGLAGLQANSLRNNHSAYLRSQATYLASGMFDRMRSNKLEAVGDSTTNNTNYNIAIGNSTPATSGSTLTQADVTSWKAMLATSLPAGDGSITCSNATRICTVIVQWDDSRGAVAAQQFSMSTEI